MRGAVAGLLLAAVLTVAWSSAAAKGSPLTLSPVTATFSGAAFATTYTVIAKEPGAKLSYAWTLRLQLVDAAGATDPATPGAHAAVDKGCNNRGVLASSATTFVWHHGDQDTCDHSKMGPSGHQGLITVSVSDGTWTCTATYRGTNTGVGKAAACAKKSAPAATTGYTCSGPQKKLLDSSNVYGVVNGGKPPAFLTYGKAYCVTSITTYHWNNGKGAQPGTIALKTSSQTLGPWRAKGSAGQGGAQNVNWTVNLSTAKPVVVDGAYSCVDSDPKTWSSNQQSHGTGFCIVYGIPAVKSGGAPKPKPTTTTKTTTTPKPKAGGGKSKKLSIKASPDNGNPPLKVTFAITSPKTVQWRVDFGDGQSQVKIGSPPATLTHTYKIRGDFRPRITILTTPAGPAQSATTSITVGTSLMSFTAKPASGNPPLRVTFGLGTSVRNITTWVVSFGDGTQTGGAGKPPASVSHTYAKAGTYVANFVVKPGAYALVAAYAQVVVGGGTPPTLSLTASPTSGAHPLSVTFTLGSNIPGRVVSWQLLFGDGRQATGSGRPPATVQHTYAKAGTFLAVLLVSQQQAYGAVQFAVPRNGLAITVR